MLRICCWLIVAIVACAGLSATASAQSLPTVGPATSVRGELTGTEDRLPSGSFYNLYSLLSVRAGDEVTLRLFSLSFIGLLGVTTGELAWESPELTDSTQGEPNDAEIIFIAPITGTYTVMVASREAEARGAYRLRYDRDRRLHTRGLVQEAAGRLAAGDRWEADRFYDAWTLTLPASSEVTVVVASLGGLDVTINLTAPDGQVLSDDDNGPGTGAMLTFTTGAIGGMARLRVTSFAVEEEGDYTVTAIRCRAAVAVEPAVESRDVSLMFEEPYRTTLRQVAGMGLFLTVRVPTGGVVARLVDGAGNMREVSFTAAGLARIALAAVEADVVWELTIIAMQPRREAVAGTLTITPA